jgi:hypothetical protein
MEALVAWLPLILILAVWIGFVAYRLRINGKHVDQMRSMNDELLTINRQMIAELRAIKEILKDRK